MNSATQLPGRPGAPGTPLSMPVQRPVGTMQAQAVASPAVPTPNRPADQSESTAKESTNVDALMDAVGASGVDISAEEERMRLANEQRRAQQQQQQPGAYPVIDRTRRQDFIEPQILAEVVKKIAAAFSLKTLEPDTIPFIALAARHRLLSLITSAIKARNHRLNASHLHNPPLVASSSGPSRTGRKRKFNQMNVDGQSDAARDEDDESGESSEDEDEDEDEQREAKLGPAWDVLIHDDPEKLLAALERVDREEERRSRRERMLRDEREAAEQERRDAAGTVATDVTMSIKPDVATPGLPRPSTPAVATPGTQIELGKDGKPKKKKKKRDMTETAQHKNMSEDVKKRLTDQVAMQSLGVKKFSWMNAGPTGAGFSTPKAATNGVGVGGLPAPKFATPTLSDLPPPTFAPAGAARATPGSGQSTPGFPPGPSGLPPSASFGALEKLDVPSIHLASAADPHRVELSDALYALERERGMGVGKGSGRNVLVRARTGVTLNRNKLAQQQQQQRQYDALFSGLPPPPPMPASTFQHSSLSSSQSQAPTSAAAPAQR